MKISELNKITDKIINASIEVHKILGPGLLERFYEEALCYEFEQRDLQFERQKTLQIPYKDIELGGHFRLDLIVENQIVVELKTVEKIIPIHEAQILTYLKITNKKLGLILNFNESLMKHGIKRIIL